ncbi:hypothetical protein A4A49_60043 [Nicotiana attenuata]|uniref:VQ domain-containing protein n=1 Tax=Nicotiana attenuata TaxID=49451 RepID=A0A1J6I6S0_NICAT|nr:hypothetical protein A4A49_60043 [Nicotiana attenuata]
MVNVKNPSEFRAIVQHLAGKSPPKSSNFHQQYAKTENYHNDEVAAKLAPGQSSKGFSGFRFSLALLLLFTCIDIDHFICYSMTS